MKFEFMKRRKKRKHPKKPLTRSDNQEGVLPESTRYFEQESEGLKDPSKEELEEELNKMFSQDTSYGDVSVWVDCKIHVYRRETSCTENVYFAKVISNNVKNKPPVSTEREVRLLKESGKIAPSSNLIDVVFWKKYRILIFRK